MSDGKLTCPSCGAIMRRAEHCDTCGYDASAEPAAVDPVAAATTRHPESHHAFCTHCGATMPEHARFCPACGSPVAGGAPPASAAPAPAAASRRKRPIIVSIVGIAIVVAIIVFTEHRVHEKSSTAAPTQEQQSPQSAQSGQEAQKSPSPEQLQMIEQFKKAVADNPNDTLALLHLANTLYDIDDCKGAIPYYAQYLTHNARNPDVRVDYAYCLFRTGQSDQAVTQVKQVITMYPKHQPAYFNLGIIYLSAGDMKSGVDWLHKCIDLDSTSNVGRSASQLLANHAQWMQQQSQ